MATRPVRKTTGTNKKTKKKKTLGEKIRRGIYLAYRQDKRRKWNHPTWRLDVALSLTVLIFAILSMHM